jgi:hypothetical protein
MNINHRLGLAMLAATSATYLSEAQQDKLNEGFKLIVESLGGLESAASLVQQVEVAERVTESQLDI